MDEPEAQLIFDRSVVDLQEALKEHVITDVVLEGTLWFAAARFGDPMQGLSKEFQEKVIAEPSRLGEHYEGANYGRSLLFEGLRCCSLDLAIVRGRLVELERDLIHSCLYRHRWAWYLRRLVGLNSQQRRLLSDRSRYVRSERDHALAPSIRRQPGTTLVGDFLARAERLERLVPLSQKLMDDVYLEARKITYSDVLRLGSVFLRIAAIELLLGRFIWPPTPMTPDQVETLTESIFEKERRFRSDAITLKWIQKSVPAAVKRLALWRQEVEQKPASYTVYDYFQDNQEFPFVGFKRGSKAYVIIDPVFAAVNLFSHHTEVAHDRDLHRIAGARGRYWRSIQRWTGTLEREDLLDWKTGLLDRIFDWVSAGPFKIPGRKGDIDVVALRFREGRRILFIGEAKRHRSAFSPQQQLAARSFIEEAHGQAQKWCDLLKGSKATQHSLEQRIGVSLEGVTLFQPFVMTPHVQYAEHNMLVFSAEDEPASALEKIEASIGCLKLTG